MKVIKLKVITNLIMTRNNKDPVQNTRTVLRIKILL